MVKIAPETRLKSTRYPKKPCTGCGIKKPTFEFQKDSRNKDNLTKLCKLCLKEKNKKTSRPNLRETAEMGAIKYAFVELAKNHRVEFERYRKDYLAKVKNG